MKYQIQLAIVLECGHRSSAWRQLFEKRVPPVPRHPVLKTANIFLHKDSSSSYPVVKLGDFGISKALDQTNALAKSTTGTPYYMSPELCENRPYSYKSDVWAVGVVLYELATLRQPFDSHNFK